jgi:anti-anti-sigma regulatory factor
MKRYKVILDEFISARNIENMFRDLAKKDEVIIFDFHKVKTLDKITFETLLRVKKGLELLGKEVFFCCLSPAVAAIVSMWDDLEIEAIFDDIF